METVRRIREEVLNLKDEALKAPRSDYQRGYIDALDQVIEIAEDTLWEAGEDV